MSHFWGSLQLLAQSYGFVIVLGIILYFAARCLIGESVASSEPTGETDTAANDGRPGRSLRLENRFGLAPPASEARKNVRISLIITVLLGFIALAREAHSRFANRLVVSRDASLTIVM